MMNENIEILIEKIKNAKNIAISGHKNLDGDALGSALALLKIIELNFNKTPTFIYDGNIPMDLDNFPLRNKACYCVNVLEKTKFDLYILVDYGTRKHLAGVEKFVDNADYVVEFDHHYNDDIVGNLCFDDVEKASTSQIIFDVAKQANWTMDGDVIDLLTLALITDTGNFKFVRHSDVFTDAAELVERGADMSKLVSLLQNKSKKTVLVETATVTNAEFFMKGRLAVGTINNKEYKKLDGRGELVLNLLAQIHGVEFVVLFKEHKENLIGVSLRSKTVPINTLAESFGGGGHLFAAGAVLEGSLEEVHDKVIKVFEGM